MYCRDISNSITSIREALDTPTPIQLSELNRENPNVIKAILIKFIQGSLAFFSFKPGDMSVPQIEMIVNSIMSKYFYFRIEDVCLCFKKAREDSSYRRFYGRVDGSVFLDWFAKYDKERESVLQSHPSNNQTIPLISQGIPWEQYKEDLERRIAEGDEEAKKNLEAMESVRRRFEEDKGQLHAYRYNRKHRFDPK
jgi:hypothetical protein